MTTTTLASGKTATEKYGAFGVRDHTDVVSPRFMFGAIVGPGGSGKTSLFVDHPGALILNFDIHGIPRSAPDAEAPKCAFWPVVNTKGQCIGEDGKPFRLNWKSWEALKVKLLRAAANDEPRPETIVFDTVPATVRLKQEAYALDNGVTNWNALPEGKPRMKAYGCVYDSYLEDIFELRYAGFGVFFIAHLTTQYFETDTGMDIHVTHNIPEKIFQRIFPYLEFLAAVEMRTIKTYPIVDGKKDFSNPVKTPARFLVNLSDKLNQDLTRARIALPAEIELPATGAWDVFEAAYNKAAGQ